MSILWGSNMTGSQGFPLTKLMAVNTGLARLRRLWLVTGREITTSLSCDVSKIARLCSVGTWLHAILRSPPASTIKLKFQATSAVWLMCKHHSAAHLRQQGVNSHWLSELQGSFSTITESTSLNRSPKNWSQVIISKTSTAMQNLVEIHPWGLLRR